MPSSQTEWLAKAVSLCVYLQRPCEEGNCVDQQHRNTKKNQYMTDQFVAKYPAWNLPATPNTARVPLLTLSLQPIYNSAIVATGFRGDLPNLQQVSWFSEACTGFHRLKYAMPFYETIYIIKLVKSV